MGVLTKQLRVVFDAAGFPLLVLVVAILLGIIGNGVYESLKDFAPPWLRAVGGFVLIMLLAVVMRQLPFIRRMILRFLDRATAPFSFIDKEFVTKRRGLIVTLGFKSHESGSAVMKEADVLKPEFLGFLVTADTERLGILAQIVDNLNLNRADYKEEPVNPTDVRNIKNGTLRLIHWMEKDKGIPIGEIAIDVTGGTTPISIGAFLAAQERGVDVNYIYSDYDVDLNRYMPDTQKALVIKLQ